MCIKRGELKLDVFRKVCVTCTVKMQNGPTALRPLILPPAGGCAKPVPLYTSNVQVQQYLIGLMLCNGIFMWLLADTKLAILSYFAVYASCT